MVLVQSDLGFPATVVPIHTIEMAIEADESILGNPPVFPAVNGCAAPGAGEGSDALQSIPAEGFSL